MNVQDAFYATVHDCGGGCESLAPRLGMSSAVLRNKANPNSEHNKPLLTDADRVMALTGDYKILHALAENHGFTCIPVAHDAPASDAAILELVTSVWTGNGDVGSAVNSALADGRIDRREIERVREAIARVERAMHTMVRRLEEMAE